MKFNNVDIGTSDFETSLNGLLPGQKVLLVEPLFNYLRNLPDPEGCYKMCAAISDQSGWGKIHYVKEEKIKSGNLPFWVRGCSSLNAPHPTVQKMNLPPDFLGVQDVRVITFEDLVFLYDVTEIDELKIDTEGHDYIILRSVIKAIKNGLKINSIVAEYNVNISNMNEMSKRMAELTSLGYKFKDKFGDNIRLVLK